MGRSLAALLLAALVSAPPPRAAAAPPPSLPAAPERATSRAAQERRWDPAEGLVAAVAALERDRRSPRGIVALAELAELEDEAPDLAPAARAYARAAEDRAAAAEVRSLARHRLAALERARGNVKRSAAQLRRLGLLGAWTVIGPFDDEGKRGQAETYPPEREIVPGGRYAGKAREVGWRELPPDAFANGFVDLGATVRPAREIVAYALATLESAREERMQLWFGGSGAAKVFVNGAVALSDPGYHPARPDQRGAQVTLRKGTNRILVKLCHQGGRMGFFLRLADARGEGRIVEAGDPFAAPAAAGAAPSPIAGAMDALERRARTARGGRAQAEARRDLAIALTFLESGDLLERRPAAEARLAAELAPDWIEARRTAARLAEEHGQRRQQLEALLARRPDDARALAALAREELDQGRPHAAARLADEASRSAPGWPAPRILRATALERAGLAARAALESAELAGAFPTVPDAVRAAARSAHSLGRVDEAAGRYRTLLALRFDDAEARSALVQLLVEKGDARAAAALLGEGIRLDPSSLGQRLRLADLQAANGALGDAEATFAGAERLAPEEPEVLERRGRARLRGGRTAEALLDLTRAIALRPQSPDLKELVRSLEPERERFEKPYLLDARALASAPAAAAPDDDAVVLGELKVTRVFPSGLSSSYHQKVVKVLNARGADAFRRQAIGWVPDRQEVRVERARVLKADGSAIESHDESDQSSSEPWYRLYYDTRVKTLSFPALAQGDVLEVAWRVDDVAGENLLSDYFGEVTFVDDTVRRARFEYVLLVPQERPIFANDPAGVRHQATALPESLVEHRFSAADLPRIDPEPGMPGWSEVARYVHVSTYGSWEQVGRFYWGLVQDPLRPGAEVKAAAERIAASVPGARRAGAGPALDRETRRALVGAVYDFVVSQTRYVGLEFGIHGYKPYRVDQVLQRRFGDCKDKASLMHALLSSLGIESRLVLLRMRRLGAIPETPASLAVFNHAILYVPELDLWLDGTAAHSGSRELPSQDRGASVLVLEPGRAPLFASVPDASAEDNRVESRFEVSVAPDGRATVAGRSRISGTQAPQYRRAYLAENDRRAQLEQAFNRTFPGLEVKTVQVSDLARIESDVEMSFTADVPRYAVTDGDGLRFTPFGSGQGYGEAYASLSSRKHDLVLGDPMTSQFTYRYRIPEGWEAVEVPEPVAGETPHAAFEVRYRRDGAALVAEGHVTFKVSRVPAAEYPAFRDLAARIDRAFARKVRIAPASAGAQAASR